MPPSRGLESGTGVVRLDSVWDKEWLESLASFPLELLRRLEMLPVIKLVLETVDDTEAEDEDLGDDCPGPELVLEMAQWRLCSCR